MLKEFYTRKGLSKGNFKKWAKKLVLGLIENVDYEMINGDYSFEATAEALVVIRLKERYPSDFTVEDVRTALAKASIKIHPFYILDKDIFWPDIVHNVHVIWRSRRKVKLGEVEGNEVGEEYCTTMVEGNNIILSAPKSMLPEPTPIIEENDSLPVYKKTERIELESEEEEEDDWGFDVT